MLFLTCVFMLSCAPVYCYLGVTCWERADLLPLVCDVLSCVCYFPIGILGQMWYLIVSIPDICSLLYLEDLFKSVFQQTQVAIYIYIYIYIYIQRDIVNQLSR